MPISDLPQGRNVKRFRGGLVFKAQTLVSLSLRLKDLLGPVPRVKKKTKTAAGGGVNGTLGTRAVLSYPQYHLKSHRGGNLGANLSQSPTDAR